MWLRRFLFVLEENKFKVFFYNNFSSSLNFNHRSPLPEEQIYLRVKVPVIPIFMSKVFFLTCFRDIVFSHLAFFSRLYV